VNRASDPRFPAALSGIGGAVSLSQVGGHQDNPRTGARVGLVCASRTSRANGIITLLLLVKHHHRQTGFVRTSLVSSHFTSIQQRARSLLPDLGIHRQSCSWRCSLPRGRCWRCRCSSSSSRTCGIGQSRMFPDLSWPSSPISGIYMSAVCVADT
jgi:hypothetical protein